MKTSFSLAAVFPSMGAFLVEVSAVDGLSSWCPVTFSSGSYTPDFICLLSTVANRVVVTLPSAVASRVVAFSLSECLFPSAEQDLFSYSVVDWVDIPIFSTIFSSA